MNTDAIGWMSDIVVPLLLGLLTLFVAIWAGRIAKQANALARQHHEEMKATEARRLRLDLAHELTLMARRYCTSISVGVDTISIVQDDAEGMHRVTEAMFAADDPTATIINAWVSSVALSRMPSTTDLDGYLAHLQRIESMIELWVRDPEEAVRLMRAGG